MTPRLVLDCESVVSALNSLAQIFQTTPDGLKTFLSTKEIGSHYEVHSHTLPDFQDYIYSRAEQQFGSPLPLDAVCWFHTTRVHPDTTFSEGILPLNAVLPQLQAQLVEAVDDLQVRDQLKRALQFKAIADHHYQDKTQDSLNWGPYAILVRDVAFCASKVCQHDYLGMPEIIEDICNGFKKTANVALIDVFSAKLKPAIVKFTAAVDEDQAYISTALCYVHSTIHEGRLDTNSVMCFDGDNNLVPPQDILKVEFVQLDLVDA